MDYPNRLQIRRAMIPQGVIPAQHFMCHEINDTHCYAATVQEQRPQFSPAFTIIEFLLDHPNSLLDVGSILNYLRLEVNNSEACRPFMIKYELELIVELRPPILNSYR